MKQKFNKRIKVIALGMLVVFNFFAFVALPATVLAAKTPAQIRCEAYQKQFELSPKTPNTSGVNIIGNAPVYCSATDLIVKVINYALVISGSITILFLIVGGFWYLTSAGNEEQTEKGKKTLINSVIGLVVIILSATIVRIVSSTLTLGK